MPTVKFDDIRPLFGLRLDSPEVEAFLARFPEHKIGKPNSGSQYVTFKPHGFDFHFSPRTGYQGGRSKHLRVLDTIFLFRQGDERHEQFASLPFGVSYTDTHNTLVRKLGKPFESSLSNGQETLTWEKWRFGDLSLHATYDPATSTARLFTIADETLPIDPLSQPSEPSPEPRKAAKPKAKSGRK